MLRFLVLAAFLLAVPFAASAQYMNLGGPTAGSMVQTPMQGQQRMEKPSADKPADEKPAVQKPADEKPAAPAK